MLLKLICAVIWAFLAGINLAIAIMEESGEKWLIFALDVVCVILWVVIAYLGTL